MLLLFLKKCEVYTEIGKADFHLWLEGTAVIPRSYVILPHASPSSSCAQLEHGHIGFLRPKRRAAETSWSEQHPQNITDTGVCHLVQQGGVDAACETEPEALQEDRRVLEVVV